MVDTLLPLGLKLNRVVCLLTSICVGNGRVIHFCRLNFINYLGGKCVYVLLMQVLLYKNYKQVIALYCVHQYKY